jgi:predicted lipoprotein with Yx(FWY)xxD motif
MLRKLATVVVLAGAVAVPAAAPASPTHAKVMLRSTSLGRVLVDARGHTLYLFEADRIAKSACYGQCAAVWPPYLTSGSPVAGPGVKAGLLRTAKRRDGKLQLVYAGHPLYFFSGDARAGQVKGEDIEHFGGSWYVVGAAGKKIEPAPAPAGGTTTTTPGYGGGYGP